MDESLLVDKWLEYKAHNQGRAAYTIYYYRLIVLKLRAFLLERDQTLLSATAETLEDYTGRHLHAQGMRPISRRAPVAAIRGFYGWLKMRRLVDADPTACLTPPKAATPLPRAMGMADAEKLLMQPGIKTFVGVRDTAMISVLIGCGCRVSGLVNLNELDLFWTVSPTGTERLDIRFREKGKNERLVPAPLETSLMIRAYLGHPELDHIDRNLPKGDKVLFVTTHRGSHKPHDYFGEARRMGTRWFHQKIRDYGELAGIPKPVCHPHALRHLYGAELAEEDVDLIQRQALLGHKQPSTTAIYTQLATRKLRETVDKANPMRKMQRGPAHGLAQRLRSQPSFGR